MLVLTGLVMLRIVGGGTGGPAPLVNPFRTVALPQSSNGSAAGRDTQVPTAQSQSGKAPAADKARAVVPAVAGAVATTAQEAPRPVDLAKPDPSAGVARFGAAATVTPAIAPVAREPQPGQVELPERRTVWSDEYSNPDGTHTTQVYSVPKRFTNAGGKLVDIDTALVAAGGGRHRVAAVEHAADIADTADDPRLATVQVTGGASVSFGIAGAGPAAATVEGATASYADVRQSSDVWLAGTLSGLKETLVLRAVDAPTRWTFPLELHGLTATLDGKSQQISLADGAGAVKAVIPRGSMEDAAVDPHVGSGAYSEGVVYSLVTAADGRAALQVDLDAGWLSDPARVFPVKVDPSVEVLQAWADDTYVSSAYPNSHYNTLDDIHVGTYNGGGDVNYGYINWQGTAAVNQVNVLGVTVSLVNSWSWSCTARPVSLYEVNQSWDGTTMLWPGAAIGPEVAQSSFAYGYSSSCPANWGSFSDPRLTALVDDWTHGRKTNTGTSVRASTTDNYAWKKFLSNNTATAANRPQMSITWTPYGAQYSYPSGSPVWDQPLTNNQQGKVWVRLTNTGRDAWGANSNYMLSYHVYDASNTTELVHQGYATQLPTTVNPGQTIDLLTTVNPLAPGTYTLRWDMVNWGTTWFYDEGVPTLSQGLIVPNVAPVVTSASPMNGAAVYSLTPTLTLTGNDPDNYPGQGVNFNFQLCTGSDANSGSCWSSGWISSNMWSPPKGVLSWDQSYYWQGWVGDFQLPSAAMSPSRLVTKVPLSGPEGHLGADPYAPAVANVTPVVGNYATSTVDASVAGVGPALGVTRTYNDRNPADGLFGVGWSSQYDMAIAPDLAGEGNLAVRYPDGRVSRFGRNPDGSFVPSLGYYSLLQGPSPRVASFTGADSNASLGSADTGEGWQVLAGTWGIAGNDAYLVSAASGRSVAVLPAGSDGTVRFTLPVAQDNLGVAFRVQDADNLWMLYAKPSANQLVLAKRVAGVTSTVATASNACCAASDVFAVTTAGSSIAVSRNDRVVATASDGAFQTATRAGLYGLATGAGRVGGFATLDDQQRDSFTRGNSSTSAGVADSGAAWTALAGVWGVDSNRSYLVSSAAGNQNLLVVNAAADGSFSFTEPVTQANMGLAFRVADTANFWRLVAVPSASKWRLIKRVSGVDTTVANASSSCCTTSDTLTVVTNGPSIIVLRNGTQIMSVTDPAVLFGTRAGPYTEGTGSGRVDDVVLTAATLLIDKTGTASAFRSDGRLSRVTDVAGRQLQLGYDATSRLTQALNVTTGRSLAFTWSGTHVSQVATNTVGAYGGPVVWSYGYTGANLTSVVSPRSSTPTTYAYAFNGLLGQTILPRGNVAETIGYNLDGTVAWREEGLAKRTTFTVISSSPTVIVRVTDPRGHAEDWEYANGQLISHRDGTGNRRFAYNDRGFLAQVTDENDNLLMLQTDTRGNILARTTVRAVTGGTQQTNSDYYSYFLGAPGDPRNDLMTVSRDGRSASATDSTYATTFAYSVLGDLVAKTVPATSDFPSGRTTTWSYAAGTESATGGGTVPRDVLLSTTDPRGKVTAFSYDSKGDLRGDVDPVGLVHDYSYDELGRRVTAKETSDSFPAGLTTTTAYDKLSRVSQVTEPGVVNPVSGVTHTRVTANTYDLNENRTQTVVSDATGGDAARTTTYAYDNDDRVTSTTAAAGAAEAATTATTYDDNGNAATVTDPQGTVTAFTYTAKNLLATTTVKSFVDDPVAGSTPRDVVTESRAYDPAGRLASVTDALGRTVQHTYWLDDLPRQDILVGYRPPDTVNGVLSSPAARDIVLADRSYDGAGNPVGVTTGGGRLTVTTVVDAAGRTTRSTVDPAGLARTTDLAYDANDDVTSAVSGAAGTSTTGRVDIGYDNASRVTSRAVFGDGSATFVSTTLRDQRGFVTGTADPRGYVAGGSPDPAYLTNSSVDAAGRVTQSKAPPVLVEENGATATSGRPTSDVGYNTFGEATHRRDTRGLVTTRIVDRLGRVTQTSYPAYTPPGGSVLTPVESWTYDRNGNVLTHVNTRGKTTSTVYDRRNRPVAVTEPQVTGASAGVSRLGYDDAGNVTSAVNAVGAWTFLAYDDLNRVWAATATERSPQGTFTTYTDHDDAGNVTRVIKPANVGSQAAWTGVYDATGGLISERDELGKLTSRTYDLAGRLASVTDPLGRSTRYTYDRAGRRVTTAQFSASNSQLRTASIGYDAAGNPTSSTDANGWTTTRSYDPLDQLRTLTEPVTASASITTSVGYDAAGHRTRLTDGNSHATVTTFNSLGLVETTIEPSTTAYPAAADRTWQTSYDAGGLPVSLVEPGGVTRARTFDALGRLTAESGSGGGAASASRTLGYDLIGRVTSVNHPSGTQSLTYNDRDLPIGSTGPAGSSSFGYDASGRMSSRTDGAGTSSFGYNARDDLISTSGAVTGGTRTLGYDDARQLTSVTYASGGAVRSFGYDQLGRTTSDTLTGPG
ncbi:DNRLRE domain-containing protein, partial [Frankia sp. Cj3]|uniref:DNRLRE domain-containing protein n=1 Tax=Frankia sp. Cj3 TaxID=2880976 RepID=UPI001EF5E620